MQAPLLNMLHTDLLLFLVISIANYISRCLKNTSQQNLDAANLRSDIPFEPFSLPTRMFEPSVVKNGSLALENSIFEYQ